MNSKLGATSARIAEFSGKTLSIISEQGLNEVRALITNYVDILVSEVGIEEGKNILSEARSNIIHYAAKFGDAVQMKRILSFIENGGEAFDKRDVKYYANIRDENSFTPLHYAAREGWVEVVKVLLDIGADSCPKAAPKDRDWMPVHYAAKGGHLEVIKTLLANQVDKEVKTSFGLTPLLVAAEFGHVELVQFLLDAGARIDVKTIADNHIMNALHYAAVGGFAELVQVLINAKISVEEKTSSGLTALYFAVGAGHADIVEILLRSGADDDIKTDSGHDLLYLAAFKGKKDSVLALLKWGVGDLDVALKIANEHTNKEVATEIKRYQKAVKNLFEMRNLPVDLCMTIMSFTKEKLSENRIVLENGFTLNAYGIAKIKCKTGLFVKEELTLMQMAHKKRNDRLSDSLTFLEKLIKIG